MPHCAIVTKPNLVVLERRVQQAQSLCEAGDHAGALTAVDAVLAEDPGLMSALLLRGTACAALRRFDEAKTAFYAILEEFPEFTALHLKLAALHMECGALEKAEHHLHAAIAQDLLSATAHANLGSLYIQADQYDAAEAPTRRALELDPGLIVAHQNLAAILDVAGSPQAKRHRDAAYSRQQIFVEAAPAGTPTVLILTSSGAGNVPYLHLLPRSAFGRILWHLEYASPEQASQLPPHDFVFNAVGDADAAPQALKAARQFCTSAPKPIFNRPDRVARTQRSCMPHLIGGVADVLVPGTQRFESTDGDIAEAIRTSGLRFPLILRPAGRHGGDGVRLAKDSGELAGKMPKGDAIYATEFVDYRSADGWYRKYRVIFVDRQPYPYHLAIGRRWLLHYKSAAMRANPALRAEEENFLHHPDLAVGPRVMTALRAIAAALDLDYAGIDFSLLPNGRLLFFEANATMLVHPEEDAIYAYKNAAVEEIINAMGAMIVRLKG